MIRERLLLWPRSLAQFRRSRNDQCFSPVVCGGIVRGRPYGGGIFGFAYFESRNLKREQVAFGCDNVSEAMRLAKYDCWDVFLLYRLNAA